MVTHSGRLAGAARRARHAARRAAGMRVVLAALLGHWRRHPVELATLLVGLAAATALWSGVQALNAEARASYARAAAVLGGDVLAAVTAADGQRDGARRLRGAAAGGLEGLAGARGRPPARRRQPARDRHRAADPAARGPRSASESGADRLRAFVLPPHLALAAPETAARLAGAADLPPLEANDTLPPTRCSSTSASRSACSALRGAGVAPPAAGRGRPGGRCRPALAERLRVAPPARRGDLDRLTESFHLNLTAFGFLSFVVGLFIVYAAIGLAFEQRRPMLRTLRACGVSARLLAAALAAELAGLALVAGLAGVAAGYVIAAALLPDVAASLRGLYGARVPGSLSLGPAWWAAGLGMSLLGALAAAGTSLWRAWTLPLLAPAQPQAWLQAQRQGPAAAARARRRAGPRRAGRARLRPRPAGGLRGDGRADARRGPGASGGAGRGAGARRADRAAAGGAMGLGRRTAGARRAVAGADGAAAGARGQRRGRHDGRQLPPHLHRLSRPAPRLRGLRDGARRRPGRRDRRLARSAAGGHGRAADLERAGPVPRLAGGALRLPRPRHLPRQLAADRRPARRLGPGRPRRGGAGLRAARPPLRPRPRRRDLAARRPSHGTCRSRRSTPTTATPRAR